MKPWRAEFTSWRKKLHKSGGEYVSLDFGSFIRKVLLVECIQPVRTEEGGSDERTEAAKSEERQ